MLQPAWVTIFRQVPHGQENNLSLVLGNGQELLVQGLVRFLKDFLVIRGRLSGTTDGGGYFFVPYGEIRILGFQRPVAETDLLPIFGEAPAAPASAPTPAPSAEPKLEPTPTVVAGVAPLPPLPTVAENATAAASNSGVRNIGQVKTVLLERLRSRRPNLERQTP